MTILCYKNELINPAVIISDITYPALPTTITPIFGRTAAPFSLTNDPLTNSGVFQVVFPTSTAIDTIVVGAHRYSTSGFRFSGGVLTVSWLNAATGAFVALPAHIFTTPTNESTYISLGSVVTSTTFKLVFTGLSALANIFIPELFMGLSHTLSNPDYGQDLNAVASKVNALDSENGTIYESRMYRRIEVSPSWSVLMSQDVAVLKPFIDYIQAFREPFFAILIDQEVMACYFFKVTSRKTTLKRVNAIQSSLSLRLLEAV